MIDCNKCEDTMQLEDSHREFVSLTGFSVIKYYECQSCGYRKSMTE